MTFQGIFFFIGHLVVGHQGLPHTILVHLDQTSYTTTFYGCNSLKVDIKEHNSLLVEGRDQCFPFVYHSSGSPLTRSAAFITSLVALRGGLDCPSCARVAQELSCLVGSLSRFIQVVIIIQVQGTCLAPGGDLALPHSFRTCSDYWKKEFNKLPVEVLVAHSIAGC